MMPNLFARTTECSQELKWRISALNYARRRVRLLPAERWILPAVEVGPGTYHMPIALVRRKFCPVRFDYEEWELR